MYVYIYIYVYIIHYTIYVYIHVCVYIHVIHYTIFSIIYFIFTTASTTRRRSRWPPCKAHPAFVRLSLLSHIPSSLLLLCMTSIT